MTKYTMNHLPTLRDSREMRAVEGMEIREEWVEEIDLPEIDGNEEGGYHVH